MKRSHLGPHLWRAVALSLKRTVPKWIALSGKITLKALRMRAYELFLERGAIHGDDLADWFRAEQELRAASGF